MKRFYLEEEKLRMPQCTFTIDRVPPKSTYMDRNRSDIVISETFQSPSEEVLEELYESTKEFFRKKLNDESVQGEEENYE